jgi:hypothetical protein
MLSAFLPAFARAFGRNGDGEEDLRVGDEDVGDQTQRNDVALEIGPLDRLQPFENRILANRHEPCIVPCFVFDALHIVLRPGASKRRGPSGRRQPCIRE